MPHRKIAPCEVFEMRDMLRVQRWKLADIAVRYDVVGSTVLENVRTLEIKLGFAPTRPKRAYVRRREEELGVPRLFPAQHELIARHEERIRILNRDPDVLRYRAEKQRATARRDEKLEQAKRELQAFEARTSTQNNRSRRNRRTA